MPRLMKIVYAQIRAHPEFETLSAGVRMGLSAAAGGYSWTTAENNKWCRALWSALYLGVDRARFDLPPVN